jgi:hypothetical protein
MTIVSLFGARRMGKSVIQRMYMEYIKEKIMNEQERSLDLQLGDALAEIMKLNVKLTETMEERDEYQVAADKLAMECKVLRDATKVTKESIRAAGGIVHGDGNIFFTNITQLQAALGEKNK